MSPREERYALLACEYVQAACAASTEYQAESYLSLASVLIHDGYYPAMREVRQRERETQE